MPKYLDTLLVRGPTWEFGAITTLEWLKKSRLKKVIEINLSAASSRLSRVYSSSLSFSVSDPPPPLPRKTKLLLDVMTMIKKSARF